MQNLEDRVKHLFGMAIEAKINAADSLSALIVQGAERLAQGLINNGKIFVCGNGGSGANCSNFASLLLNRFETERPPLPVISLSSQYTTQAIAQDDPSQVFARQIHALASDNDVLLVISTSGNHDNLLQAVNTAIERGMSIVALLGKDGGVLSNHLSHEDLQIKISLDNAARIKEMHLFILHCFCDLIDQILFSPT